MKLRPPREKACLFGTGRREGTSGTGADARRVKDDLGQLATLGVPAIFASIKEVAAAGRAPQAAA